MNLQQKVDKKNNRKEKKDREAADASSLNEGDLKKAAQKKHKLEADGNEDVPLKLTRTNHSQKSGRKVGQEMVDELVGVKPSRQTRSSESDSLKTDGRKRKPVDEQELAGEKSGKRMKSSYVVSIIFCLAKIVAFHQTG